MRSWQGFWVIVNKKKKELESIDFLEVEFKARNLDWQKFITTGKFVQKISKSGLELLLLIISIIKSCLFVISNLLLNLT